MNFEMQELLANIAPKIVCMHLQEAVEQISSLQEDYGLEPEEKKLLKALKRVVKAYEIGDLG